MHSRHYPDAVLSSSLTLLIGRFALQESAWFACHACGFSTHLIVVTTPSGSSYRRPLALIWIMRHSTSIRQDRYVKNGLPGILSYSKPSVTDRCVFNEHTYLFGQRVCLIMVQKPTSEASMSSLLKDDMEKKARRRAEQKAKKKNKSRSNGAPLPPPPLPATGRIVGHYVLKLESRELNNLNVNVKSLRA